MRTLDHLLSVASVSTDGVFGKTGMVTPGVNIAPSTIVSSVS